MAKDPNYYPDGKLPPTEWEYVGPWRDYTKRLKVEGGWIYKHEYGTHSSMVFVPEKTNG